MEIGLLVIFGVFSSAFCAYTKNIQETTLELGKRLAPNNPMLPRGFQDAITPSWQTRNNLINYVLWILLAILSFISLVWWVAIPFLLVVFFFGTVIFSLKVFPRPMSPRLIRGIKANLDKRLKQSEVTSDTVRLEALRGIIVGVQQELDQADQKGPKGL